MPLVLLAHEDSWFDHPLTGNGLPLANTDVIAQLQRMGSVAGIGERLSLELLVRCSTAGHTSDVCRVISKRLDWRNRPD